MWGLSFLLPCLSAVMPHSIMDGYPSVLTNPNKLLPLVAWIMVSYHSNKKKKKRLIHDGTLRPSNIRNQVDQHLSRFQSSVLDAVGYQGWDPVMLSLEFHAWFYSVTLPMERLACQQVWSPYLGFCASHRNLIVHFQDVRARSIYDPWMNATALGDGMCLLAFPAGNVLHLQYTEQTTCTKCSHTTGTCDLQTLLPGAGTWAFCPWVAGPRLPPCGLTRAASIYPAPSNKSHRDRKACHADLMVKTSLSGCIASN